MASWHGFRGKANQGNLPSLHVAPLIPSIANLSLFPLFAATYPIRPSLSITSFVLIQHHHLILIILINNYHRSILLPAICLHPIHLHFPTQYYTSSVLYFIANPSSTRNHLSLPFISNSLIFIHPSKANPHVQPRRSVRRLFLFGHAPMHTMRTTQFRYEKETSEPSPPPPNMIRPPPPPPWRQANFPIFNPSSKPFQKPQAMGGTEPPAVIDSHFAFTVTSATGKEMPMQTNALLRSQIYRRGLTIVEKLGTNDVFVNILLINHEGIGTYSDPGLFPWKSDVTAIYETPILNTHH